MNQNTQFFFTKTEQIDEKYPPRDVQLYMPWFERMQQDFWEKNEEYIISYFSWNFRRFTCQTPCFKPPIFDTYFAFLTTWVMTWNFMLSSTCSFKSVPPKTMENGTGQSGANAINDWLVIMNDLSINLGIEYLIE